MKWVPILKVADNITTGPSEFLGECTYYATADVGGNKLLKGTQVRFRERPSRANLTAQRDDLLFAKMQATDKVVHIQEDAENALFSTGFFNLRARQGKLVPRYLFWYLNSRAFQ